MLDEYSTTEGAKAPIPMISDTGLFKPLSRRPKCPTTCSRSCTATLEHYLDIIMQYMYKVSLGDNLYSTTIFYGQPLPDRTSDIMIEQETL